MLKNTKRFEKYLVKMLEHGSFQFNCDFQKGFSPIVSPLAWAVKKFNTIIIAIITWAGFEFMRILTRDKTSEQR